MYSPKQSLEQGQKSKLIFKLQNGIENVYLYYYYNWDMWFRIGKNKNSTLVYTVKGIRLDIVRLLDGLLGSGIWGI